MKNSIFFAWEFVESATFVDIFDRACFEKLGYYGWCVPHFAMDGCEFSCGAYEEEQEEAVFGVLAELIKKYKGV